MSYRCLLIDDEPLALDILERYVAQLPSLRMVKRCSDAFEALRVLHAEPVDLLFLDIKMPGYSGVQLIRSLPNPPPIILTTAYSEFAVESYELGVADYLLKPFSFDRFLKAVNRVMGTPPLREPPPVAGPGVAAFVFLKADRQIHKLDPSAIQYVEAYGNFVKVYLTDQMLLASDRLTALEEVLVPHQFLRVHRSFLVALHRITRFTSTAVWIGKQEIPVGNLYRRTLTETLQKQGNWPDT
ncbi:LytR/AlgR family response regulator transcription factor [uncultured Fibrella sp.]|uniref:LytR/AlgR family response regulator transcription factor n=1 Tax=uncultured Fibrella sp. TaxID=1284596 RepID=UPI0035CAB389